MAKLNRKPDNKLSEDELKSLTGFFDVLIQIDLEQKRKAKLTEPATKKKSK